MTHRALLPTLLCLAAACGGSGAHTASSDPSAAQACVDRINALRATKGLPALARWTAAEGCADSQAQSDSESGKAHGAVGACGERGQNECWATGMGGPAEMISGCLEDMWAEGPGTGIAHGHYNNMVSTAYAEVACGFHVTSSGEVWAVQDFN